jgi:hypothetical protein
MTSEFDLPAPPKGLKTAGKALWRAVIEGFELRPDEMVVLAHACALQDRIGRLERKQEWSQARLHRLSVAKLLQQLDLGGALQSAGARSDLGRRLARARWSS